MSNGQQQQDQGANSMDLLWGVALFVAVCLALWFFARGPIIQGLFLLKLGEIKLVSLFSDQLEGVKYEIYRFYNIPRQVTLIQLQSWFSAIGMPLRIPIAVLIAVLGTYIYFKHPILKFKHIFSMNSLRSLEKENWPQITPVCDLDLVSEDITEGPWAMADSPMVFAKKHKLLEELPEPIDPFLKQKGYTEVRLIQDKAKVVFTKQMGPVFEDLNKMPIHAKALFAAFAARAAGDMKGCDKLMEKIARSSARGKPDFSGAMPLLRKHYNTKEIATILGQHGYLYTILPSILEHARSMGVFATADFLWLKPIDRRMWYMLNCTGRRTAFCDIAGPFSHWLAEKSLKRKLTQPMVEGAITALEEGVKLTIYTRDE